VKGFWRNTAWLTAIAAAIVGLLYLLVFDTWEVPAGDPMFSVSVAPNLSPGDRILTRRGSQPVVGQLARCASPQAPGQYVVGRVYGLAGSLVQIQGWNILTDGVPAGHPTRACGPVPMTHPATGELMTLLCGEEDAPAWTFRTLRIQNDYSFTGDLTARIDPGKAFLVSDNRVLHQDSRDFGQVDYSTCEHVVFRLWGKSYLDSSRRNTILY
jgi:signal peptidase I